MSTTGYSWNRRISMYDEDDPRSIHGNNPRPGHAHDARVVAIRQDPDVGRGSMSDIDETWEDHEILDILDNRGIRTPKQAVDWAKEHEGQISENPPIDSSPGYDPYGYPTG